MPVTALPRLVGILGGMGPAATADLLQKIVTASPAGRDQDQTPSVVWNVPQIPSRVLALSLAHPSASPDSALRQGARRLADAGAQAIAIACNTAHHWADAVQEASQLPLLHIADSALQAVATPEQSTLLLATSATVRSGFYQRRAVMRGITLEVPTAKEQGGIDETIALVKAGDLERAKSIFVPLLAKRTRHHEERGPHCILACTELPLLISPGQHSHHFIDATNALAERIVEFSWAP
jgi:aspartate racemase